MNVTWRCIVNHSNKKQSSYPKSVCVYLQPQPPTPVDFDQTVGLTTGLLLLLLQLQLLLLLQLPKKIITTSSSAGLN